MCIRDRRNIEALTAREHELKDALYLAQQSSDAKKDFLSRMSHEIRTPMNIIVGMTTIAGANLEDKNRVKDCLSKIAFSSKHLLSLINDILDMSKIEEGKLTVNNELFRLPQMFEAIVPAIYSQAEAKGSVFECKFDGMVSDTVIGDSPVSYTHLQGLRRVHHPRQKGSGADRGYRTPAALYQMCIRDRWKIWATGILWTGRKAGMIPWDVPRRCEKALPPLVT